MKKNGNSFLISNFSMYIHFIFSGAKAGKFSQRKALLGIIFSAPKFGSYEIYVVINILMKTIFILFKVFSGKISSKI